MGLERLILGSVVILLDYLEVMAPRPSSPLVFPGSTRYGEKTVRCLVFPPLKPCSHFVPFCFCSRHLRFCGRLSTLPRRRLYLLPTYRPFVLDLTALDQQLGSTR